MICAAIDGNTGSNKVRSGEGGQETIIGDERLTREEEGRTGEWCVIAEELERVWECL